MKLFLSKFIKNKLYLLFFILVFIGLLSIYGIKGAYSRYAQDDYCYGYHVKEYGFWNSQILSYFTPTEFNSNRYSLTFAHSTVEVLGGATFVPVLPILEIVVWSIGLWYLIYQLLSGKKSFVKIAVAALSALGILFFTFFLSGNLYQILFWLSGMQTYLTPMVLNTFIFGRLAAMVRAPSVKIRYFIEIALLCLIAGGFSETTALWMFVCLWLILLVLFITRKHSTEARPGIRLVVTAIIATGIALIILAICPVNYYRSANWTRPDLPALVRMSLFYGEEFIRNNLKAMPLPFAILMGLGFWLGILTEPRIQRKAKLYLISFFIAVALLFVLSITTMIPTEYAMSAYPGDRALLPALFSLIVFLFFTGWLISRFMLSLFPGITANKFFNLAFSIIGLVLFAYLVRITPRVYDKLPLYQARAQAWDLRNQLIFSEKAAGTTRITIPQFDSVYGITELEPETGNWVNGCAARYYGVQSIAAIENYMGISTYPIGK